MVRVKFISLWFSGLILLCFIAVADAQSVEQKFEMNLEKANEFLNIDSDSILYYANEAYKEAQRIDAQHLQLDAIIVIIHAQLKLGKFAQAITSCSKADSIILTNNIENRKHEILMYKGLVFQNAGFVSEGLDYLYNAEKEIENSGADEVEADLLYYIALAHFNIREYNQCRNNAKKAAIVEQKRNNMSGLVKNYVLLSNSFSNIDSIRKYLSKAKMLLKIKKMDYKWATFLNNEALFFKQIGKLDSARTSYIEAINIASENGYREILANLYNNYAYLLMQEQKLDSVADVLKNALSLSIELGNIDLEASIMDTYSDYYLVLGDSAMSYRSYKKSIQLRKQYTEKQRVEQSLFLTTVFETEKKEKEIARQESKIYQINTILFALLALFSAAVAILIYFRQKSAARKAQIVTMAQEAKLEIANALIEGQDAERKRLAMDLHDGIGPRIGMLKMTIDTKIKEDENYSDIIDSLTELGRNIRDMSHRMLPPQLESHGLAKALENMILISERNSDYKFIFYTNLKERLNNKLEINLFFLSYEIINNAIKHANGTEISIQLLCDKKSVSLSVEDDGVGFDPDAGFDGIGLKNIRQRVKYLDGNLTIDSGIGQGTAIIIEVKL